MRPVLALLILVLFAACGGADKSAEVAEAYRAYRSAMASGDPAALKNHLVAQKHAELDAPEAADMLAMAASLSPSNAKVLEAEVDGDQARLKLLGSLEGNSMEGTIEMRSEGGVWKVVEESWTSSDLIAPAPRPASNFAGLLRDNPGSAPLALLRIPAHEGPVQMLEITPNGYIVSIGYDDKTIKYWDSWGKLVQSISTDWRPHDLAMMSDGSAFAVVSAPGDIYLYDLSAGWIGEPRQLTGGTGSSGQIAISSNGKQLAATSFTQDLAVWDLRTGAQTHTLKNSNKMRGVAFSPQAPVVVYGSQANWFGVWQVGGKNKKHKVPKVAEQSDVWSVDVCADGERVVTGHMDSSISVWDLKKGKQLHNFYVRDASTIQVRFGSDNTLFATAHQNGNVYFWDYESAQLLGAIAAHKGGARTISFSKRDGSVFATGGDDGEIACWAWAPAQAK